MESFTGLPCSPASSIRDWLPCSPLGSGSFSHVSLALTLPEGLLFAVKSSRCPSPSSPSHLPLDALDNELLLLQSLSSPYILRCFGSDYTTHLGCPVSRNLFLEYMESGSLSDLVKKTGGRLQEKDVRWYTRAIVEGLCYLHKEEIVHCDIKGQNILVGSSGVKIADFGAAKRLCTGHDIKEFKGTPLWMAPEVAQGIDQGFPSDIWSLGCTVVEMLQGRPPWGHLADAAAALYKVGCSEENPPLPNSISEEASDFLVHCLQRDPRARWTALELLQHPFVCGVEAVKGANCVQPSPRSTLDFNEYGMDSEDESEFSITTPILHLPSLKMQKISHYSPCTDNTIPQECDWITVRSSAGWSSEKQMPFMKFKGEASVRRGGNVSFECAEFLKNKRVVG